MDYSKNAIRNLIILSLFIATIVLLCSWEPSTYKPWFFTEKHSDSILEQKDDLEVALKKASMANRTVIITIINKAYVEPYKNEYPSMFDLFLEGFWVGEKIRPLINHLLVVTMDKTAHERCEFRKLNCYNLAAQDGNVSDDHFAQEKIFMSHEFLEMMWRRTLFLLDVLKRGYNFIFTDTDVIWLRNPFTRLMMKNETTDFQISTDAYNGTESYLKHLINTGFYFIRSNNKTTSLFQIWYDMRKNSTGMKEQDVLFKLIASGTLEKLKINAEFLDTMYFSGFCMNSRDVREVLTVHANCCRSIKAKVTDLKAVLRDWKGFKDKKNDGHSDLANITKNFRWSRHVGCGNSWRYP